MHDVNKTPAAAPTQGFLAALLLLVVAIVLASQTPAQARDRWKLSDDGSCYFDPNDTGPDQCEPQPGRYKLDANGTCYYDAGDTGPNQCSMLSLQ